MRRIAVENFLFSMAGMTYGQARANVELDARLYGWNAATRRALVAGIDAAEKEARL